MKKPTRSGTTKSLELRSARSATTRLLVEAVEEASQRPRTPRFDILEAVPSCFSDRHGRRRSGCTARLCWISSISVALGRATACLSTPTGSSVMIVKARATLLTQSSPLRRTVKKWQFLLAGHAGWAPRQKAHVSASRTCIRAALTRSP